MAIEGPLRELGIHDVFQLLDLSRKTGMLRVTSELRDDEGIVIFESGRVVQASVRSNPMSLEDMLLRSGRVTQTDLERARVMRTGNGRGRSLGEHLVQCGALSRKELERQMRLQIESVVFELMSWREGFFSFEELAQEELPAAPEIHVSTESLLMEGARRIDEWSRIADKIPSLTVVPTLAPVDDAHPTQIDLLPDEWEVLTMIDGKRDLRAIATALGRAEFDIAKVVYGLVTTGVVEVQAAPERRNSESQRAASEWDERLERARKSLDAGDATEALAVAAAVRAADPARTEARLLVATALTRLRRHGEALDELRRAVRADPRSLDAHHDLGFAAARMGDFATALASWEQYLRSANGTPSAERVRLAAEAARRLVDAIDGGNGE
jgi:tetratricopeptide (TPR) repeat protein